jgi:hypothetical protein
MLLRKSWSGGNMDNVMAGNNVTESDFIAMQSFMVEPIANWTTKETLLFPWLFIIPAEILGLISSSMIFFLGSKKTDLPHGKATGAPVSWTSWSYIIFSRLVMLPFISLLIVKSVWASDAVVYDMEKLNFLNGAVTFAVFFSLSDCVYYASHRIVHKVPMLYKFTHKHHHGEGEPSRGWADTCNAHPLDFFLYRFLHVSHVRTLAHADRFRAHRGPCGMSMGQFVCRLPRPLPP